MRRPVLGAFGMLRASKLFAAIVCGGFFTFCLICAHGNVSAWGQVTGVRGRQDKNNAPRRGKSKANRRQKVVRNVSYSLLIIPTPHVKCKISLVNLKNRTPMSQIGDMKFELSQGSYELQMQCDGYETHNQVLNIPLQNAEGTLPISLSPLKLNVMVVTTPPEAKVFLNRTYQGTTNSDGNLLLESIRAGEYFLSAEKEGFIKKDVSIELLRDKTRFSITLLPDPITQQFKLLQKALSEERLVEAFDLYDKLSKEAAKQSELKEALNNLFEILNRRSLKMLEEITPYGLKIELPRTAEMRRLYAQAQSWQKNVPGESNFNLTVFAFFWELKGLVDDANLALSAVDKEEKISRLKEGLVKLEALRPNNAYILFDLGWIYYQLQDLTKTRNSFSMAQTSLPNWAYPYFGLGMLLMNQADNMKGKDLRKGGLRLAIREFEMAIAKDENFASAYIMLAFCYADTRRSAEGINSALKAVNLTQGSGLANFALGYAYFSAGKTQYANARRYFEAAISAKHDPLDSGKMNRANELLKELDRQK